MWKCRVDDEPTEKEVLAYDATRDPAWATEVDSWPWIDRDGETTAKSGACQRCGHQISVLDQPTIIALMQEANRPNAEGARKYAACNCGVTHSETPEGAGGCGANGLIKRPDGPSAAGELAR
jgi:hypothetical protein